MAGEEALLTNTWERMIAGTVRKIVREELRANGLQTGGLIIPNLKGSVTYPWGLLLVATKDPLQVLSPATPVGPVFSDELIDCIYLAIQTPPVGGAVVVDIRRRTGASGGESLCDGINFPTIPDGQTLQPTVFKFDGSLLASPNLQSGDWLWANVTNIGTGTKGSLLSIVIKWTAKGTKAR